MQSNTKITISGFPGSGKTTVAKLLSERTGFRYVSTGQLQREIAAVRGMSTLELNRASERDGTIDEEIDARTLRIGRSDSGIVFDSRLAWRILPRAIKVFIACSPKIAGERVQAAARDDEKYANSTEAASQLRRRFDLEYSRFRSKYGAKLDNLRNFDLIVDSSILPADAVVDAINLATSDSDLGEGALCVVLSPKQIFPLGSIRTVPMHAIREYRAARTIDQWKSDSIEPLKVIRVAESWFAIENHVHLAHMLDIDRLAIPCRCVGVDDDVIRHRLTARQLVLDQGSASLAYDWEEAFGYSLIEQAEEVYARLNPGISSLQA